MLDWYAKRLKRFFSGFIFWVSFVGIHLWFLVILMVFRLLLLVFSVLFRLCILFWGTVLVILAILMNNTNLY